MQMPETDTEQGFSHPEYKALGEVYTEEKRKEAGFAAIALLYGADWSAPEYGYYLRPAYERLSEIAGEEGFNAAADEVYLMALPDRIIPHLVEEGIEAIKNVFNFSASRGDPYWDSVPHAKRYWQEVMRAARNSVKGATA